MKIIERTHNVETNEIVDTEREMTAEELAQWKIDKAQLDAKIEADKAKVAEKAALLAKLGITAEEAALLLA